MCNCNPLCAVVLLVAFACCAGEQLIGARAYRVMFALVSLPLATVALVYFINHRYSGMPLWDVRGVPGVHEGVWLANFLSFYFLYPSTFNILEVRKSMHPMRACLLARLLARNGELLLGRLLGL
jgi:uncharacterized membrane protein